MIRRKQDNLHSLIKKFIYLFCGGGEGIKRLLFPCEDLSAFIFQICSSVWFC